MYVAGVKDTGPRGLGFMTASYFPPFSKAKGSSVYGFTLVALLAFDSSPGEETRRENYRLRKVFFSLRASATDGGMKFSTVPFPTARNCSILSTNHRPFYLSFTIPLPLSAEALRNAFHSAGSSFEMDYHTFRYEQ